MNPIKTALAIAAAAVAACTQPATQTATGKPTIAVSIPAAKYFADRLGCGKIDATVMIPQSAGHSTYTPTPTQMAALTQATAYLAIGNLDFELTWHERMQSVAPNMKWIRLDKGIEYIENEAVGDVHDHRHATDPHYWLSPKRAMQLTRNMADALKQILPSSAVDIDSACAALQADIAKFDQRLQALSTDSVAFLIYHPALTFMAADYGFQQFEIEKHGNAPSPKSYAADIDAAQRANVKIVFVQQGYDTQKAATAAEATAARVVEFSPEGYDWPLTMNTIINSLEECYSPKH